MEEKEQLRRQIRLLQGLIDDYKSLHGSASAPGTSAALGTSTTSQWQPPTYNSSRTFSARYPRPSRRGFSLNHGPAWRKKYSLVNRPLGSSDPPGDGAAQPPLRAGSSQGPEPQEYILERQVQLNPDQNMVIKIKPPSKPGSASTAGVLRTSLEEYEDPPWNDHRPQEGEGESSGAQRQPSRQGRAKGGCSAEDPLLVCQKEAGKPRVVKSVSSVSENPLEPRRTVSESAVAVRARVLPSSLPQRGGMALGRKAGSHSVASSVTQLRGDGSANTGLSGPSAASSLVVGPARPAVGPRQTREPSVLVSCRTNKFQKNNYKWVAASAKSPRASRRALSPRAAAENVCKAPFAAAERTEKPQLKADPDAKPRRPAVSSVPGASPSKYKWKASSPSASSASSFRWQSEVGSKDRASQLSPIPSRSPPADRRAVEPSSLQPVFSETPLSAYKVKSRTKIIRRRGSASLPADKKSSPPPAAVAKSQFSLRRKQALRGKSSPVTKKTPNKGLMPVTKPRPCCLPPGRAYVPSKEASSLHGQRPPPTSKVIRTRYRIVKKTPTSPLSTTPGPPALPSWRARRLSLSSSFPKAVLSIRVTIYWSAVTPTAVKGYEAFGVPGTEHPASGHGWESPDRLPSMAEQRLPLHRGRPLQGVSQQALQDLQPARRGWRRQAPAAHRPLGPCQQLQPLPGQPGRAAQPGHRAAGAAGAAAAAAAEGGVLHVLQPLRPVQPWRALPLRPRPREGGCVHQVCPGHLQEDGRDLPLLPPRLQGEDACLLLLPEGHLQQQQLPLQPCVCVPQGGGLHRLPERLLPSGCQVQEEAHAAVPRLLPPGRVPPRCPVPAAPPQPEAPGPASSHPHSPGAWQHAPQEQGFYQPWAQEALGRPAPRQTDVQPPQLHGCWLDLTPLLPTGVSCGLPLPLLPLPLLLLFPLPLLSLPPLRLPVLGARGAVSAGG
ncbi:zinc finger CCCH domain-containing protein 3 isoform X2 [Bos taurus]|uniref:zinc finger CCCH domain-containing protein 3 isoform X2 n=1 Tax=Bos taurus TaxID=9913 RepID=UPI0028CBBD9B|nr:zinc finger CCCH domain-containing protein 3 isoform X2 [Bos taurus]